MTTSALPPQLDIKSDPSWIGFVPFSLRVAKFGFIVPAVLLGFAVAFTAGMLFGPEADRDWLTWTSLALWILGLLALWWVLGTTAGIDESQRIYVHRFGGTRRVDLSNLKRISVWPRVPPKSGRFPEWVLRLKDGSGNTLRLNTAAYRDSWRLFRPIARQVELGLVEIDPVAREVLMGVALSEVSAEEAQEISKEPNWGSFVLKMLLLVILVSGARVLVDAGFEEVFGGLDACEQSERLNEDLAHEPDPATPPGVDLPGSENNIFQRMSPLLLENPGPGYEVFSEGGASLLGTANSRHDPDSLELLRDHSFRGSVARLWHTPQGLRLEHQIYEFGSPRDAQSFEVHAATYTCRFANSAWRADLPHPSGGFSMGLGFQVRHRAAAIVEQISWVRGTRRHVISVGLPEVPKHHGQIAGLARLASVRDAGV